jgi:hypothetical protein
MRTFVALLSLCLCPLLWTEASGQAMTEAEIAQIEAEVMEWAETWMEGWNAGTPADRCEATLALIHPDHVVFLSGGAPQRKADWLDWCLEATHTWLSFSGSWTEKDVRVLSPDATVFLGAFDGTWEHVSGRIERHPTGAQLLLVERTVDGWSATSFENSNGPAEVADQG